MAKEQFMKLTFKKALNQMIKRLKATEDLRESMYGEAPVLFENISAIPAIDKRIVRLYEYIYFNIKLEQDIVKIAKKLADSISQFELDTKEFYLFKFEVFKLLQASSIAEFLTGMTEEEITRVSLLYFIGAIVELIKYRSDKRIIIGVDVGQNTVKYISNTELYLDLANSKFVTAIEKDAYIESLPMMANSLAVSFPNLSESEAIALANDKIDECLNDMRQNRIILDLLGKKGNIDLATRIHSTETGICLKSLDILWKSRSFICEDEAVIYYKEGKIRTIKLHDVMLKENYPCLIITYITDDNIEDTVIIPTKLNSVIHCAYVELLDKIDRFFNGEGDAILVGKDFWNHRFDKDKEGLLRKYKDQVKVIKMHKAMLGNPSAEVLAYAKEWGIELKPGQTLVKKHIRRYGKIKSLLNSEDVMELDKIGG